MRISDWSSDVCSSDLGGLASLWISNGNLGNVHRRFEANDATLRVGLAGLAMTGGDIDAFDNDLAVAGQEVGRASCRERVCQYVSISVVAVSFTNKAL